MTKSNSDDFSDEDFGLAAQAHQDLVRRREELSTAAPDHEPLPFLELGICEPTQAAVGPQIPTQEQINALAPSPADLGQGFHIAAASPEDDSQGYLSGPASDEVVDSDRLQECDDLLLDDDADTTDETVPDDALSASFTDDETIYDDFDEYPARDTSYDVQYEGAVDRETRGRKLADDVAERYGWDEEGARILDELFLWSLHGRTRVAVEELIRAGCSPEELLLAHQLRIEWMSRGEYWISLYATAFPNERLKWSVALKVIHTFRGYPAIEEAVAMLAELFDEWCAYVHLQREYPTFHEYVDARSGFYLTPQMVGAAVMLPQDESDFDGCLYAGFTTPEVQALNYAGLLPDARHHGYVHAEYSEPEVPT